MSRNPSCRSSRGSGNGAGDGDGAHHWVDLLDAQLHTGDQSACWDFVLCQCGSGHTIIPVTCSCDSEMFCAGGRPPVLWRQLHECSVPGNGVRMQHVLMRQLHIFYVSHRSVICCPLHANRTPPRPMMHLRPTGLCRRWRSRCRARACFTKCGITTSSLLQSGLSPCLSHRYMSTEAGAESCAVFDTLLVDAHSACTNSLLSLADSLGHH